MCKARSGYKGESCEQNEGRNEQYARSSVADMGARSPFLLHRRTDHCRIDSGRTLPRSVAMAMMIEGAFRFLVLFYFVLCIGGIVLAGILFATSTVLRKRIISVFAIVMLSAVGLALSDVTRVAFNPDEQRLVLEGDPVHIFSVLQGTDPKLLKGVTKISVPVSFRNVRAEGVYRRASRDIRLSDTASEGVFSHELHHHIWYEFLTDELRAHYVQIHAESSSPTVYGRDDVEEDFADSGALFAMGMLQDPRRREFFEFIYDNVLNSPYVPSTNLITQHFYTEGTT